MQTKKQCKGRKGQRGRSKHDITFMRHVALSYIEGDQSLNQLSERFGVPNQTISRWALRFSSELAQKDEVIISPMTEQEQKDVATLEKQIEALKKKLEYEQMKNFALETLADLAKTELGIDIRKNSGAKQPKE
jgi:transposase-like protein